VRKDAKIALCVILALMVLVVVIWGRSQPGTDLAAAPPPREQARLPEDESHFPTPQPDEDPAPPPVSPEPYIAPDPGPDVGPGPVAAGEDDGFTGPSTRTAMINHFGPLTDQERADREAAEPEDDPLPAAGDPVPIADTHIPSTREAAVEPEHRPLPGPTIKHTIARGDTYQSLARKYYKSPGKWRIIYDANGIPPQKLHIDKVVIIPPLPDSAAPRTPDRAVASTRKTYEVKKGDNFYNIARIVYRDGNKWKKLYEANKSKLRKPGDPGSLRPGIILDVPKLASAN